MKPRNTIIVAIAFISLMMSACSSSPKITSATEEQVVIKAKPEKFLDAYDIAKRECDKNARIATYITDGTDSLGEVAFNCFNPNPEPEVVAESDVDTATEEITESVTDENSLEEPAELVEESLEDSASLEESLPVEEEIQ